MKILGVSTSDRGGGAERMAWLGLQAFRARGHDAWLVVGEKKSDDERVLAFHESPWIDYRPYDRAWLRSARRARKALDGRLGLEDFHHPFSRRLLEITGSAPDVVHCHNLHGGYFDPRILPSLSSRVPVFLSLHDFWTVTGHCAFAPGCDRWRNGCGACPDLELPPRVERDGTRFGWRRKARIWRRSRLRVMVACQWMLDELADSSLAPAIEEARVVPNAVDLRCFRPGDRLAARRALGLPADARVLLFVAHGTFANPFKDGATVRAVAERLAAERTGERIFVLAAGGPREGEERDGAVTFRHLGYRAEPEALVAAYRAADVLLHASRRDVLPLTLIEALACELPVVASAVGGIPELVREGETGRLFPERDVEAAARAVAWTLDRPEAARALAARGAERVRAHCDHERIADRTLAWFEEVRAREGRRAAPAQSLGPGAFVVAGLRAWPRAERVLGPGLRAAGGLARAVRHPGDATRVALRRLGLAPRLGQLSQHAPRPLRIPARTAAERLPEAPPSIALVTPCLDSGPFLERTLESVLSQGYPRLQYAVQDGGSRDGTRAVLDAWAPRLHHVASEPDRGQADAIDRGFRHVEGEIMAWLNADDLLLPGALACAARFFSAHPEVDVLYGHRVLVDEQDREIGCWILPEHDAEVLRWVDFVPQETLFWRRRAWEKVGARLDEDLHYALDWDLLLRFAAAGLTMVRVPRFLGAFRVHPKQKTTALPERGRREMDRLRQRELGFAPTPAQVHRRVAGYYLRHLVLHARHRVGLLGH